VELSEREITQLINQEGLLKECQACEIRPNNMAPTGTAFLSKNRIAFRKSPNHMAGLLMHLIPAFKGGYTINVELNDIQLAQKGKFGRNKNILSIETKSGADYRILVDTVQDWIQQMHELKVPVVFPEREL